MSIDSSSRTSKARIASRRIRIAEEPVLVEHGHQGAGSLTVTPILEGGRIATLEIRCACGQSIAVDCVYDDADELSGAEQ